MTTVPAAVTLGLLPEGYTAGAQKVVAADAQMVAASRSVSAGLSLVGASGRAMAAEIARSSASAVRSLAAMRFEVTGIHAAVLAFAGAAFLRKVIGEVSEAQAVFAQLQAGVKSTGGAAGLSAQQLAQMASEVQKVTTYSDEAIGRAESLLLTFQNIKGDTFRDATVAVVDLATRMDGDLKGAAIQVGKALDGSKAGITALTRSGVSFSEEQKKVIARLFATGQAAEAQKIILQELSAEFGGSASAARDTLGGALSALKNKWDDLFESIGQGQVGEEIRDAIELAIKAIDALIDEWPYLASATDETLGRISGQIGRAVSLWIGQFERAARGLQLLIELTPASTLSHLFGSGALPSSEAVGGIADRLKAIGDTARETGNDLETGFGIKADEALRRAGVAAGLAATGYRKMGNDAKDAGEKARDAIAKMVRELERSLAAKQAELAAVQRGDTFAQRAAERAAAVAKAVADARERLANAKIEIDPKTVEILTGLAGSLVDVGFAIDDAKAKQEAWSSAIQSSSDRLADFRASFAGAVTLSFEQASETADGLREVMIGLLDTLSRTVEGTDQYAQTQKQLTSATETYGRVLSRMVQIRRDEASAAGTARTIQAANLSATLEEIRLQTALQGSHSATAEALLHELDIRRQVAQIVQENVKPITGESIEDFGKRWLAAAKEARAALEENFQAGIQAGVNEPVRQAAATMRSQFLDAIAAWVGGAKVSFGDLIRSWLQMWIRAFAEWLARWIAVQIKAAAAQRAANLGSGGSGGTSVSLGGLGSGGSSLFGGVSAGTVAAFGAAVYAAVIIYKGFIRNTSEAFTSVSTSGLVSANAKGKRAITQVQSFVTQLIADVKKLGEDWNLGLQKIGDVTLAKRGKTYIVSDLQNSVGRAFDSVEAAVEFAKVRALQLAQVSDQVGLLVETALRNSRATTLEGLKSDIDLATLLQTKGDQTRAQILAIVTDAATIWTRAVDLFRTDTIALAQALSSAAEIELGAWQNARDAITGRQRTEAEDLELRKQQAVVFNAERQMRLANIQLLLIQIRAEIALRQATVDRLRERGITPGGSGGGHNGDTGGITTATTGAGGALFAFSQAVSGTARVVAGATQVIISSGDAQLDALRAQEAALADLYRLLSEIPPINPDEIIPRGGRGGGGNSRADDKKFLEDFFKQVARARMTDVGRALAEINDRYEEARRRAHGNAEILARLNEERKKEIDLLKRNLQARARDFIGKGGDLGATLRGVDDQVHDLITSYRELHDAGEITTEQLHRMVAALIDAAEAQRQAIVQAAYNDVLIQLLDATGRTTEAAKARWQLAVLEYHIKIEELKIAIQKYQLEGFNIALLEKLLADFESKGPPADGGPTTGPTTTGPSVQDLYRQRLEEQQQAAAELRNEALRLLRDYQGRALNPLQQALAKLAEDFQKIRAAFGNTAEVQQAYNAALLRIIDDQLKPIQDYLDSINLSPESPLDPQAQLDAAQQQYQALLAAVQAGDYSRISELTQAAQQLLQAQGAVTPQATQAYRDLFAAINAQLLELQRRIREQAANGVLPGYQPPGTGSSRGGTSLPPGYSAPSGSSGGTTGTAGGSSIPSLDPVVQAIERSTGLTLPYFSRIARAVEGTEANTNRIALRLEASGGSPLPS